MRSINHKAKLKTKEFECNGSSDDWTIDARSRCGSRKVSDLLFFKGFCLDLPEGGFKDLQKISPGCATNKDRTAFVRF